MSAFPDRQGDRDEKEIAMYLYFPTMPDTYPELVLADAHRRITQLERERVRRAERRARRRGILSLRRRRRADYAPPQEDR
ncbi:hypothetical protein [Mumia zhuanghuii]|uniref:Uncharacterized protein n=1 Tax=Mumia zhuanghuii TaxID=2585211 RepID=A0A5C4MT94_9ACTN|nr:hypothetical protein [Mumia zhuanghuii]TNC47344.1 hypothetical protein FHE65_10015 [Mumia zhuanghuii]TNC47677.1 hypothetical protein FHE65_09350 [Mumia zhuanghuii]